ncbi:MAG TPA: hypothetical protein VEW03_01700, partial [Longimicrobiaceae bacterium]|nr:hypothetical protein [Longimicrobiaceae bacterium]
MSDQAGRPRAPERGETGDEASLMHFANALLRSRYLVIGLPLLFGTVAVVATRQTPRQYKASASFVPNAGGGTEGSSLSLIANQLGMNLGASEPGHSPMFYRKLLTTRDILRDAVQSRYQVRRDGRT